MKFRKFETCEAARNPRHRAIDQEVAAGATTTADDGAHPSPAAVPAQNK